MNSPDKINFSRYIRINRKKSDAIYLQIVYQFINAVQRGDLKVGEKIVGSRVLSENIGVHRKTVVAAMEELQAQGWVEMVAKKGTFVQNPQIKKTTNFVDSEGTNRQDAHFTFAKSFVLDSPFEETTAVRAFNDGQPDYRLVNLDELSRFYRNALKRKQVQKTLGAFSSKGNTFFLEQLSYYLNLTRGIHISKEHLITAKNKSLLLYTTAQLLLRPSDVVLVGELSYFFANMTFQQFGVTLKTIPVDENGMDVSFIAENFKKGEIRCVYLNARNYYPTTVRLSEERKIALLELAKQLDFVIVEDDEDFEFQYEKSVYSSLFSLDKSGVVIYLGVFGKLLTPTFQTGFLLAPKNFSATVSDLLAVLEPQKDIVTEQALGEMIEEGDYFRYHKKSVKVYRDKRNAFAIFLTEKLGNKIHFQVPESGLAFWVEFSNSADLSQFVKQCKEDEVFIPRICIYQTAKMSGLRLGFA